MIITIISFIIILSILVLVHELGHFLVAKKLGIKVEEFGIGFPPKVFGKKIGETLYSINLLPVGGFVKLYGEDSAGGGDIKIRNSKSEIRNSENDLSRAFFARPLWQRIAVVTAGVIMNFILAVFLISFLFASQGVSIPTEKVRVTEIQSNSPAQKAGLHVKDRIVLFNGKKLTSSEGFISQAQKFKGQSVTLLVERNNKTFEIMVIPRVAYPKGEGPIGLAISNVEIKKYTLWEAPFYGTLEALKVSYTMFMGLSTIGTMLVNSVLHLQAPEGIAGPVGVAQLTGKAVAMGLPAVLWFMALLSLNLAVLNILPIPALDGGRFFFLLVELAIRRKLKPQHEATINAVGLVMLLGLMIFFTYFDIARWIQGKSILP